MKRNFLLVIVLLAIPSIAHSAASADSPVVGRYQLGGTERDGLILLDTATGHTWKYSRDARAADQKPVWMPLGSPQTVTPAASVTPSRSASPRESPAEQPWVAPGPYKDKRPGGK